jgi:hypothetical protein
MLTFAVQVSARPALIISDRAAPNIAHPGSLAVEWFLARKCVIAVVGDVGLV